MHQHGFHVERRFGWDTHGLPVEYEIDKTLGIKGPQDVAKMGIAAYNAVWLSSHRLLIKDTFLCNFERDFD